MTPTWTPNRLARAWLVLTLSAPALLAHCRGNTGTEDDGNGPGRTGGGSQRAGGAQNSDGGARSAGGGPSGGRNTGSGASTSTGGVLTSTGGASGPSAGGAGGEGGASPVFCALGGGADSIYLYLPTETTCMFLALAPEGQSNLECIGPARGDGYCVVTGEFMLDPGFCLTPPTSDVGDVSVLQDASGTISVSKNGAVNVDLDTEWSAFLLQPSDGEPRHEKVEISGTKSDCSERFGEP